LTAAEKLCTVIVLITHSSHTLWRLLHESSAEAASTSKTCRPSSSSEELLEGLERAVSDWEKARSSLWLGKEMLSWVG
jgi:hypothetical protein